MSTYEETISMIGKLNEDEFFSMLETARRHADEGRVKEAHEVARNIRSKHGL